MAIDSLETREKFIACENTFLASSHFPQQLSWCANAPMMLPLRVRVSNFDREGSRIASFDAQSRTSRDVGEIYVG
jgi:hypothetical protein